MLRVSVILLALCMFGFAAATEYDCKVGKKVESETTYTAHQIEKGQFSVKVEESGGGDFVSRCSFSPSANKVTCDRYQCEQSVKDHLRHIFGKMKIHSSCELVAILINPNPLVQH